MKQRSFFLWPFKKIKRFQSGFEIRRGPTNFRFKQDQYPKVVTGTHLIHVCIAIVPHKTTKCRYIYGKCPIHVDPMGYQILLQYSILNNPSSSTTPLCRLPLHPSVRQRQPCCNLGLYPDGVRKFSKSLRQSTICEVD